jgi:hypothetical protein
MSSQYDGFELYDSPFLFYDIFMSPAARKKRMKVKFNLLGLTETERVAVVQDVVTHLTGNPAFTTPNPALAGVQTRITTATAKIAASIAATTGARNAILEKRAAVLAVENDYKLLGTYVDNVAAGDEAKITSAGFEVRPLPSPLGVPTAPLAVLATAGEFPGQLLVDWEAASGSVAIYEIQTTLDPMTEASWVARGTSTKTSVSIVDLPSGEHVWVRVRATGSAGPGPYSDAASRTVP